MGQSNISSIFQHGLQDAYLSLNPHVEGGLFPIRIKRSTNFLTASYLLEVVFDTETSQMMNLTAKLYVQSFTLHTPVMHHYARIGIAGLFQDEIFAAAKILPQSCINIYPDLTSHLPEVL